MGRLFGIRFATWRMTFIEEFNHCFDCRHLRGIAAAKRRARARDKDMQPIVVTAVQLPARFAVSGFFKWAIEKFIRFWMRASDWFMENRVILQICVKSLSDILWGHPTRNVEVYGLLHRLPFLLARWVFVG